MDPGIPLHLPPAAVESRYPWVLLWCFAAIGLLELYSLFPGMHEEVEMFWLDDQKISFQAWVDYAGTRAAVCVFLVIIRNAYPKYHAELNVFFWLAVGYLADYFVIYNDPYGKVHLLGLDIPISYTLFMLIIMIFVVGKTFYKSWK